MEDEDDRSSVGALGVCHLNRDRPLTPISIGQNEVSDVTHFIRCIPDGWGHGPREVSERKIDKSVKGRGPTPRFEHKMDIFSPTRHPVFVAYFDTDLKHLALFGNFFWLNAFHDEVEGITYRRPGARHELEISLPKHHYPNWPDRHPITELCHRAFNRQQDHIPRPGLENLFPPTSIHQWFVTQSNVAARADLPGQLEKLCTGWTKFYFRLGNNHPCLVQLGPETQLFGLTWIFPWARSLIKAVRPNCLELDGTFESLEPYTLEIFEAIIANESIPIGLGVAPTETGLSYERLYNHLKDVLGADAFLLTGIPLLSDRGGGLDHFAKALKLIQLICHWHLIHGAGAASIGGDWIRRLCGAGDLDEAKDIMLVIRCELAAFQRRRKGLFVNASYYGVLMRMLNAVEHNVESELYWWARWMRRGCPTTTNAAESIHALINELTRHARSFFHILKIIKKRLWQRFDQRDHEDRIKNRSINHLCHPDKLAKVTPGNKVFYEELSRLGRDGPYAEPEWRFPRLHEAIPTEFPPPEWLVTRESLPPHWAADAAEKKAARAKAQEEKKNKEKGAKAPAPLPGSAGYLSTGHLILRSIKFLESFNKITLGTWENARLILRFGWSAPEVHHLILDRLDVDA
jgi:hypothetical protein